MEGAYSNIFKWSNETCKSLSGTLAILLKLSHVMTGASSRLSNGDCGVIDACSSLGVRCPSIVTTTTPSSTWSLPSVVVVVLSLSIAGLLGLTGG